MPLVVNDGVRRFAWVQFASLMAKIVALAVFFLLVLNIYGGR